MEKSIKINTRPWERGDLVRIKTSRRDGTDHESIGVVINFFMPEKQLKIFEEILIFDSKLHAARKYYCYDIELITAAA